MKRLLLLSVVVGSAQMPEGVEFFESKVRPLLAAKCTTCHNTKMPMAGLNLSSAESFRDVTHNGTRLLAAVTYEEKVKMPPTGKLAEEEIALLRRWVEMGAPFPGDSPKAEKAWKSKQDHWSFQPVRSVELAKARGTAWVRKPVDRFVLARLEAQGIQPAEPASKLTLLRRVTYDLTGLPPTPSEVEAYAADKAPDAYDKVVERLLASPRYGEKWGRHWLDVARYADSTGMDEDHVYPHAWRYRDYVVDAFNKDKPYNQFVIEQIAGDLLPPPAPGKVNTEALIATGFLALGPKPLAQQDRTKMIYDVIDEQIDVTSKAFLGLSVACARCHDHKFDPILTRDYYGLAAIYANTRNFRDLGRPGSVSYIYYGPLDLAANEKYQQHRQRMYRKRIEMEEAHYRDLAAHHEGLSSRIADYFLAAWQIHKQSRSADQVAMAFTLERETLEKLVKVLSAPDQTEWKEWREANAGRIAEVAANYAAGFQKSAKKWEARLGSWRTRFKTEFERDRALPDRPKWNKEDGSAYGLLALDGGPFQVPATAQVAALRVEWKKLEETLPPEPEMASAVCDGPEVKQHIFVRGDHHSLGEPVGRSLPLVLAGNRQREMAGGSGRLDLARWLASPANPLTARVMVNRIWQWHFGEGIVRTPNNWGATGEKPTHPELLDWLAGRFIESGWSIKAMHREIVLSSAYRMSTQATAEARAKDPANRLFSRFAMRRLQVEEIRDSLLAFDRSLDATFGGTLLSGKSKGRANPDENRRRTLYTPVRRGSIPALLATFDYGDATTSSEGRTRTNVAPQALFMMNSDFVRERAQNIAKALVQESGPDDTGRLRRLYLTILGREPEAGEADQAFTFLGGVEEKTEAWVSLCRVLVSSNEFVFLN